MLFPKSLFLATTLLGVACASRPSSSSSRRNVTPFPKTCAKPKKPSPARTHECVVKASNNGDDDAPAILHAVKSCNHGGTVVLDGNYTISSPLDLTFLDSIDFDISGNITFTPNIDYWVAHSFKYTYQTASAMWRFGGSDVNIYGGGLIDGQGNPWWLAAASNSTLLRPVLFVLDGMVDGSVSNLRFINPPNWFNLIANSSSIIFSDMDMQVQSISVATAPNTDGWDVYRSDSVVIQDSIINNTDDCVSFKPNATNVIVQGLQCSGSHGISVGSLGQYVNEVDIVENIYVYNISMSDASDGARIKVWPGVESGTAALNGGGGSGYVKNVTYDTFKNYNNDWAIELNQCYEQSNQTLCVLYPSLMKISDVVFKNMYGTTSTKYEPDVGTLVCSGTAQCQNITATNVTVTPPNGASPEWICENFDYSGLQGFDCVA